MGDVVIDPEDIPGWGSSTNPEGSIALKSELPEEPLDYELVYLKNASTNDETYLMLWDPIAVAWGRVDDFIIRADCVELQAPDATYSCVTLQNNEAINTVPIP